MRIGGGILEKLRRRKPRPLDLDHFGWRPAPLARPVIVHVLSDADFEARAVAMGRDKTDEAFTAWGGWTPVMVLRARSAVTMFAHELRHATPARDGGGRFHDEKE